MSSSCDSLNSVVMRGCVSAEPRPAGCGVRASPPSALRAGFPSRCRGGGPGGVPGRVSAGVVRDGTSGILAGGAATGWESFRTGQWSRLSKDCRITANRPLRPDRRRFLAAGVALLAAGPIALRPARAAGPYPATIAALQAARAKETTVHQRYTAFAQKAKQEGYEGLPIFAPPSRRRRGFTGPISDAFSSAGRGAGAGPEGPDQGRLHPGEPDQRGRRRGRLDRGVLPQAARADHARSTRRRWQASATPGPPRSSIATSSTASALDRACSSTRGHAHRRQDRAVLRLPDLRLDRQRHPRRRLPGVRQILDELPADRPPA